MAQGPRFYLPFAVWHAPNGVAIPGARLNFYLTGSDTRTPTYADIDLSIFNTNPVVADDLGTFPDIFLDPTITYKVVLTGRDDGITLPLQYWTGDPVKEAWLAPETVFWDMPFEFLAKPGISQVIGMYVAVRPQRIFGDFDGTSEGFAKARGAVIIPPADGEYIVRVFRNNNLVDAVGFMLVEVNGTFGWTTDDGSPIDLDSGEFLTFQAAPVVDSVMSTLGWTITGKNL